MIEFIDINDVLAQSPVVENLKNFTGIDVNNKLGQITDQRLAAVVGGFEQNNSQDVIDLKAISGNCFKIYDKSSPHAPVGDNGVIAQFASKSDFVKLQLITDCQKLYARIYWGATSYMFQINATPIHEIP